jgi:hypothetical protein
MKKLNSNHKTIATAQPTGRGIKRLTMAVLLLLVSHWVTAQTTFSNIVSLSIPADQHLEVPQTDLLTHQT